MVIRNTIVDINSDVKVEKSNIGDRVGLPYGMIIWLILSILLLEQGMIL